MANACISRVRSPESLAHFEAMSTSSGFSLSTSFRILPAPAFGPTSDGALQRHPAAIRDHLYAGCIERRVATKGILDSPLDVIRQRARREHDQVGDAFHPAHAADPLLGALARVIPLDLPFESHPAVLHHDAD